MATKTYYARFINTTPRIKTALERTHYVYVECLRQMIERYIAMRKGKFGEECRQLVNTILSRTNTFAHGVMDKLTREQITSRLDDEWVAITQRVLDTQGPLFLQHEGFAVVDGVVIHTKSHETVKPSPRRLAVPAKFWHQVCDMASSYLQSNAALMQTWRDERRKWVQEKVEWEKSNPDFMKFWNGQYKEFEDLYEHKRIESQFVAGQVPTMRKRPSRERGKRIDRWHLWYEWIISHPEIIEWRQQAQAKDFRNIPQEVQREIQRKNPQQHKYIPVFLKWLRENNPELSRLDSLRRIYVNNYCRFKRPPTLTLPSPKKHPYWFTFERKEFYKSVDFEKGTISLFLIDQKDNGAWFFEWFDAQIKCDPRLKPSVRAEHFQQDGRYPPYMESKPGRKLNRPAEASTERMAGYTGAKLILRGDRQELLFTVIEQDCPPRIKWQKTKARKCRADNAFSPNGERIPLKIMAIDLGIRHTAAYVIAEGNLHNGSWNLSWQKKGIIKHPHITPLRTIREHDWELRKGRRKQGKAAKGERTFVDLQNHRTSMADDRFKKAANTIVETARKHDVHLILFEQLKTLFPRAFGERWMNRQLRDMNHRRIVEMVKAQSKEFGIICEDNISSYMTSQICSRCYKPGWRFSIKGKDPYKEKMIRRNCQDYGYPIWDRGGHLFRCPHCGYRVNSDINAAGNIAARFFGIWPEFTYSKSKKIFTWQEDKTKQTFDARETFESWSKNVRRRKQIAEIPF
jgi:IS605 OrfB family transposase